MYAPNYVVRELITMIHMHYFVRVAWILNAFKH